MTTNKLSRRKFLKIAALATASAAVASIPGIFSSVASAAPNQTFSVPSRLAWWYDNRFGMFIHFGSYSYYGQGEWVMANGSWSKQNYQTQISKNFNPTNFNATTIATLAKNAGMKYLVITAKHHEGFAMWDRTTASFKDYTGATLYSLRRYTTSLFSRDILMELKTACEAQGIKFCLYYSILDWNHSSQSGYNFTTMSSMTARTNYINDMKTELAELITKYNPAILWFDGDWTYNGGTPTLTSWWTKDDGIALQSYLMGLSPNLIINERVCRSFGIGDYTCPEQTIPTTAQSRQWETCQTMNNSWGYNSGDNNWKSVASMIQELVTVVSRDGNYLLNIGPQGDGTVPSGSVTILNGFQTWMATYSDSIYGTTGTPFMGAVGGSFNEPSWGRYTKKSGKLFAHVFTWPSNGILTISGITNTITKIYLMNNPGTSLSWAVSGGNIDVTVGGSAPNANVSVVVVECSGVPTPGTPSGPTATPGPSPTPGAFPVAGTQYRLVARHSGKVADVSGGSMSDGGDVIQWTSSGSTNQKWTFVSVAGGYYKIINVRSGKLMGVSGGSTADGGDVIQWSDTGALDQQWTLTSLAGGYYRLTNRNSGKVLDVNGASTADGANIIQWTNSGSNNQQWQIIV